MTHFPDSVRRMVHERADGRCEYCLLHERYTMKTHEVDHVYAEKHGGDSTEVNLCLSCFECNRYKGSDLCSLDTVTGEIVSLYHLRRHRWTEHFRLENGVIYALTPQGRVTVQLLRLNTLERITERQRLEQLKRYP
jgi:hypothetical protein